MLARDLLHALAFLFMLASVSWAVVEVSRVVGELSR